VCLIFRKKAGLPSKLRINDLRQSFASHAMMSGDTPFATSLLLGHPAVDDSALRYLADNALLPAAEKMGALVTVQAGVALDRSG